MKQIWELNKYKENIAFLDEEGTRLTYAQVVEEGRKIADAAGGRCLSFILAQNSIGSVLGYVSFLTRGIVPAMLSANLESELLEHLLKVYQPEIMWLPKDKAEILSGILPKYTKEYESYGYMLLKLVWETDASRSPLYDELALLLTTSGSTGSPKFVRQSYDNILSNAQSICSYLRLDATERPITTLPMNYTYGLSIINSHLLVGAAILITDKSLMQKEFWKFFKEENATSFGGVPYTYEILDKLRFMRMNLPSLRTMTQAGGKLSVELHEKFAGYAAGNGKNFVVMYGQCEATARMAYLPAEKALEKKGAMGIAIPGGEFRLIDDAGDTIHQTGVPGELVYSGRNVTLGYAECYDDLAKGDERGGVLQTGDIAQRDVDGYYYIVGRKKRFLKIYGNRVNLDEIDQMIKGKFEAEVACAGMDDKLYIFLTDAAQADEIRDYVAGKTKLNPAAFKTFVLPQIPKNEAGKTLYKELEKYY